MRTSQLWSGAMMALVLASGVARAGDEPVVEQRVKDELAKMVAQFEGTQALSFKAVTTLEDVSSNLQKLQFDTVVEGVIQRPNKLYLKKSGYEQATMWFDGQTVTILDRKANKYTKIQYSGNFSGLINKLEAIGVDMPFAGMFDRTILKHVNDHVFKGDFYGASQVGDTATNHMAFRQDEIDWQLWTAADTSLPKKIVITSKMLAGAPQHSMVIQELKKNPEGITNATFMAQLPNGATEVQIQNNESEMLRDGSW